MEEYISGERHKELNKHPKNNLTKPILVAVVGVLIIGVSFYSGMAYQKSNQPKLEAGATSASGGPQGMMFNASAGGGGGPRQAGFTPIIGTVTAVSDTSISLTETETGEAKTLTIASTTSIVDSSNEKAAASTIKVGDKVMAIANQNDNTVADRIAINPEMGATSSGPNAMTVSQ